LSEYATSVTKMCYLGEKFLTRCPTRVQQLLVESVWSGCFSWNLWTTYQM